MALAKYFEDILEAKEELLWLQRTIRPDLEISTHANINKNVVEYERMKSRISRLLDKILPLIDQIDEIVNKPSFDLAEENFELRSKISKIENGGLSQIARSQVREILLSELKAAQLDARMIYESKLRDSIAALKIKNAEAINIKNNEIEKLKDKAKKQRIEILSLKRGFNTKPRISKQKVKKQKLKLSQNAKSFAPKKTSLASKPDESSLKSAKKPKNAGSPKSNNAFAEFFKSNSNKN